jgi:hypothetical protein
MPSTTGSNKEKRRGSLTILPHEGVSSNPTRWSKNGRWTSLPDEGERERGHPPQCRPMAAMAGTHGSPESFSSKVFDHHSACSRYQSVEELNANSSTQVREARTDRGRDAAQEGGGAITGFGKLTGALCSRDSRHHRPKERHGERQKEMTSSPMQRRRARAHRQAPTTDDSKA